MEEHFRNMRMLDHARSEDQEQKGEIFRSLYFDKDPLIVERLFPSLQAKLSDLTFQDEFLRKNKVELMRKRENHLVDAERCKLAGGDSRFYTAQLPPIDRELAIESFSDYQKFLQDPDEGHLGIIELMSEEFQRRHDDEESNQYVCQTYQLYRVTRVLYDHYVSSVSLFERFDHPATQKLVDLYKMIKIDLETIDTQFSKYGLLSMGADMHIANSKEFQSIVDERIGLNFGIAVPRPVLAAIEQAITQGMVTNIAFHIECIVDQPPAFEDLEYGALFGFDALQLPELSKLYDGETYGNALWVKMEKQKLSMTFEELCADFPERDDTVVTNLVHLEFFQEQGRYFIGHLDHEYILYTLDQYAAREVDSRVKGHRKLKTFKIDCAKIPFDFKLENRYFIFLLLDCYFKNKALIREYFSKVID